MDTTSLRPDAIEIFPQVESYFDQEAGLIKFANGKISQIVSLRDNTQRSQYQLEPQLITNVSGVREKRRMVAFRDIPPVLVQAVTSAEDKRFFQHAGFDPIRILKAAYIDVREGRKDQGASTLSQQLARMFWLDQEKRWTRKLAEMVITLQLEQRLSKEEIFEDYANQIDLGWRGTYNIRGFGAGCRSVSREGPEPGHPAGSRRAGRNDPAPRLFRPLPPPGADDANAATLFLS